MRVRPTFTVISAITLLVCYATLGSQTNSVGVARKSIQAMYDKQEAAASRFDTDGQFIGYAPDYILIDVDGEHSNLIQGRQTAREVNATMRAYSGKTTIQKISVMGNIATVRVSEHSTATLTDPRTNQLAHVVYNAQGIDTWKKNGKSWLLTRSKTLSENGTLNGHPVPNEKGEHSPNET